MSYEGRDKHRKLEYFRRHFYGGRGEHQVTHTLRKEEEEDGKKEEVRGKKEEEEDEEERTFMMVVREPATTLTTPGIGLFLKGR